MPRQSIRLHLVIFFIHINTITVSAKLWPEAYKKTNKYIMYEHND